MTQTKDDKRTLIFVYNANSGLFNGSMDVLHKVFSPETYSCNLCKITYGALSVKKDWKKFIDNLPLKTSFYHRDEWKDKYKINDDLPAVFLEENDTVHLLISKDEMNKQDLNSLKKLIKEKLDV